MLYSIRDNHSAEENFINPETFDPDRWENGSTDGSAFLPFGGHGIRSCVGRHYTVHFIRTFITIMTRNTDWKIRKEDTEFSLFPVQLPKTGLPMQVQMRKQQPA